MPEAIDFFSYKYRKWAEQYVDMYEMYNCSLSETNQWARENIPALHFKQLQPLVKQVFEERGYKL